MYIQIDGQPHSGMRNLEGNKGFEVFHTNGKKIVFLLRNSAKVSDVSTYTYRDGPNNINPSGNSNDRWSNRPNYNEKPYGVYGSFFAFSWQGIVLKPQESKTISFSVGVGEYINPHTLRLVTNLNEFYDPYDEVSLTLNSDSVIKSKTVTVTRTTNMSYPSNAKKTVKTYIDTGSTEVIEDKLDAPYTEGIYRIIYTIESEGLSSELIVNILYTEKPVFHLLGNLPDKISSSSLVKFGIRTEDDSNFRIFVKDKTTTFFEKNVLAEGTNQNIFNFSFGISSLDVNNVYNCSIYIMNEFNIKSDPLPFNFIFIEFVPPEFSIINRIRTFYLINTQIVVRGLFRDIEGTPQTCIHTAFNFSKSTSRYCEDISDSQWHPFEFNIPLENITESVTVLSIFPVDSNNYKSDPFTQAFAIYSNRALGFQTKCYVIGSRYEYLWQYVVFLT